MNVNVVSGSNYHDFAYTGKVMQDAGDQEKRNYVEKNGEESIDISSNMDKLKDAIEYINDKLQFTQTKLEYTYHEDIRRISIKIIDKSTDDIIREIPPEETIKLIQKMWEFAGLIVDERR